MTHSDDDGIILPPRVASSHVVLLPIFRKESDREPVMTYVETLSRELKAVSYHGQRLRVEIDDRDIGGARGWDWIKKGIPIRLEIGPRDMEGNQVFMGRRDKAHRDKTAMKREVFVGSVVGILDEIQQTLYDRAALLLKTHTRAIDDKIGFYDFFTPANQEKPEIHGGFAMSHWCGKAHCEERIKDELSVTIRCIPFDAAEESGTCIFCGEPSTRRVLFAKAY